MTKQQRRPGYDPGTAAMISVAAENSVPLALVEYTVRLALDDDSRLYLDDLPARSKLVVDVSKCRFPGVAAIAIASAARRGVRVEIEAGSVAGVRAWYDAIARAGVPRE